MPDTSPPIALTVAGSDCSAGAGIQADLKTFSAHRVFGMTAVTCVVSESSREVDAIEALPPAFLASQIKLLTRTYPITAIKTGMLFSRAHITALLESISTLQCPIVVDPVMVSGTGTPLIEADAIALYRESLLPIAALATPNLDEACLLLDASPPGNENDLKTMAQQLVRHFACPFLLKGGHLNGPEAIDILADRDGTTHTFRAQRIDIPSTHGTGCTYSAAITANLANGHKLQHAISRAKNFITRAISQSHHWQSPDGQTLFALDQCQYPPPQS